MSSKSLEHSSRDERIGGLWGTSSQGARGRKGLVGGGGCHLRMPNLLLKTKHFLALAVVVPVPANVLSQVALIVFSLLLLFYIVTKSREHKIYHLAILKHTVNQYQIHSHCYATSSTIPPWDTSHPVQQKLSICEVITAPRSPWQPSFNLPSPCIWLI